MLGKWAESVREDPTAELRRSEQRFRSLLQYSSDVVFVLSADHVVQFVTDASEWVLGHPPASLLGTRFLDLVHPEERTRVAESFRRATGVAGRAVQVEHRIVRPVNSWTNCDSVVVDLLEEPSVAGLVVTARDVTERQFLEAELREAQRLESVGRLAAGVAHEINTPMQYVGDNIRFLEEALVKLTWMLDRYRRELGSGEDGSSRQLHERLAAEEQEADIAFFESEAPEAARGALQGVERVSRIVRAMKAVTNESPSDHGPVFLSAVLEDAMSVARNEYQHVAEVETDFPDVPPVPGYASELSQVFVNLLANAGHAIAERGPGEPGRIRISVREEGDAVAVRIGDNGCGIPEDHRAKVFDQFFTTRELGQGTGQGLALARGIVVNRHGGELSFTSDVGKGTVFCVRLPLEAAAPSRGESGR